MSSGGSSARICSCSGLPARGYEIRHGRVDLPSAGGEPGVVPRIPAPSPGRPVSTPGEPLFVDRGGAPEGWRAGPVLGTSWHGATESDAFRRALLGWVAGVRGLRWVPGADSFAELRERRLDRLGDLVEEHVDGAGILRLIESGVGTDLPFVAGWDEDGEAAPALARETAGAA